MRKNKSVLLSVPYILWMVAFTLIPLGVVLYYALTDVQTGAFSLQNITELVLYLPAGLCFAWAYQQSGTILAPIIIHAANNLLAFLILR